MCFGTSIYWLCQVFVHREGVDPSSMEGVLDLSDHISVEDIIQYWYEFCILFKINHFIARLQAI